MKTGRLILAAFVLVHCGCAGFRAKVAAAKAAKPPAATVGPLVVTQSGSAEVPASSNVETSTTETVLPAGSVITVVPATENNSERVEVKLSAGTTLKTAASRTVLTAPRAFAPPAPPSARELANADGVAKSYWFAGALALGAAALAYTGHGKAALFAAAGAVAAPLLANFVASEIALRVVIGCACVAGALFAAYHLMHRSPEIRELKDRLHLAEKTA